MSHLQSSKVSSSCCLDFLVDRSFARFLQHADEVSIVNGVLLTAERSVSEAMITMDKVEMSSRKDLASSCFRSAVGRLVGGRHHV